MNYRKSRKWMWILFLIGLLIGAFGAAGNVMWPMLPATAAVLIGVLQAYLFYRCPHCEKSLMGVRGDVPKHCPNCGEKLK